MRFTDITYYRGEILIPFANKDTTSFEETYIDVFEEDLLVCVLGRKLYNEFIAGLSVADPLVIDPIWIAIRDGKEYNIMHDGLPMTVKWEGLKNTKKVSPLSYFVYTQYIKDNYKQMTGLGNSVATKENAESVSISEKAVNAYRKCARLSGHYPCKSDYYNNLLYPNDIDEDLLEVLAPSLLNFLYYHKTDYPSWVFKFPDIYGVNDFDI